MSEVMHAAPTVDEINQSISNNKQLSKAIDAAVDKIDIALPGVDGLDDADKELDELAELAKDNFDSMMTLGMNVEPRYSGVIFQSATTLLGHAIAAKTAKIDKKLKMIDLQLKKAKLDQGNVDPDGNVPAADGKGMILDRNELLKSILASASTKE